MNEEPAETPYEVAILESDGQAWEAFTKVIAGCDEEMMRVMCLGASDVGPQRREGRT